MPWRAEVGFGGAYRFAPPGSGDPGSAHQSGDLVTADIMTGAAGGFPELASAVDAIVVLP